MSKLPMWLQRLAVVLAWLLALGLLVNVALHGSRYQWDFKVYYEAARTFAAGGDPYAPSPQTFTPSGYLPFLYPPLTLSLFRVFTLTPLLTAATLWLGLKCAALAPLLTVWSRRFLRLNAFSAGTVLYILLSFNAAFYIDIASGNVTVFEELALWLGFACLLAGRSLGFCLCLILAAQFKLTPMAFLVLLLLVPPRPHWRVFFAGLGVFCLVFSLNALLYPGLTHHFFTVASGIDHRGSNNPSTLAFFRDCCDTLHWPHPAASVLYLLTAAAVLGVSTLTYAAYRRHTEPPDPRLVIVFACLVYALCVPRFTNYTYILLLIPGLFVLRHEPRRAWMVLAGVLVLLPGTMTVMVDLPLLRDVLPTYHLLPVLLRDYLPLWSAFVLWGLTLRRLRSPDVRPLPDLIS